MKDHISELDRLSEGVGHFIKYWGFKKIHGKVWCYIFLSDKPLDATELLSKIDVSKAFMSRALSDLVQYEVIEEVESEGKVKKYQSNPQILKVIFSVLRSREKIMLSDIFAGYRNVCSMTSSQLDDAGICSKKLQKLGRMIQFSERFLNTLLSLGMFNFQSLNRLFEGQD